MQNNVQMTEFLIATVVKEQQEEERWSKMRTSPSRAAKCSVSKFSVLKVGLHQATFCNATNVVTVQIILAAVNTIDIFHGNHQQSGLSQRERESVMSA